MNQATKPDALAVHPAKELVGPISRQIHIALSTTAALDQLRSLAGQAVGTGVLDVQVDGHLVIVSLVPIGVLNEGDTPAQVCMTVQVNGSDATSTLDISGEMPRQKFRHRYPGSIALSLWLFSLLLILSADSIGQPLKWVGFMLAGVAGTSLKYYPGQAKLGVETNKEMLRAIEEPFAAHRQHPGSPLR